MPQKLKSPAKINLTLDILAKDTKTGFHKIQSIIMEYPDLYDEITVEKSDKIDISFKPEISCPVEESTVFKAAKLILPSKKGIKITLKKKIPEQAGLGGGASNAATTLKAINKIYELGYTKTELQKFAKKIGMDVPFFLEGKTAFATHFGEKLKPLPDVYKLFKAKKLEIKILESEVKVNTKNAYNNVDITKCGKFTKLTDKILKAIEKKDIVTILENLHNDFEISVFPEYPFLVKLAQTALAKKALAVNLTGSGGALFAIFK